MRAIALLLGLLISAPTISEVIPVEPFSKGFFGTYQTMTFLEKQDKAELTVVVIMGYPGNFGLKPGDIWVKNQTAWLMLELIKRSKITANVVILDSPFDLKDFGARSSGDHIERIESVVKYYSEKFKLPIWLFGHSDGSISVSEYLNYSDRTRKSIVGAILSSGRNEIRITEDWKIPVLVMHHEKDGCVWTTFNNAKRNFAKIQKTNKANSEFATVVGGYEGPQPCSNGFHMYSGAFSEALDLIENFIVRNK